MSDEAKAITAVAETTGKAIDAGRSIGGLFKELAQEKIGMRTDEVKAERYIKRLELTNKVMEKAELLGHAGKLHPVDDKLALPWLDHAPLEEDETLQNMWINLLLSASVEGNGKAHPSFVDILKTLSPEEAKLLETFKEKPQIIVNSPAYMKSYGSAEVMIEWPKLAESRLGLSEGAINNEDAHFMFSNLKMLSLIEIEQEKVGYTDDREREAVRYFRTSIKLSVRGKRFLKAVTVEDIKQT